MSKKFNFGRKAAGKGYYIALILCAVAIGIAGYMYFLAANEPTEPQLDNPNPTVGNDVQAGVTTPSGTNPGSTEPVKRPYPIGRPVAGETTKDYAMDCLSYNETTRDWRVHNGVDIAAEESAEVCAAADGVVYTTYKDDHFGMTVVIRHDGGYTTQYASLAEDLQVSAGDSVKLGQAIGCVGSTALIETAIGPHVHFSVTYRDEQMDPAEFLSLGQ